MHIQDFTRDTLRSYKIRVKYCFIQNRVLTRKIPIENKSMLSTDGNTIQKTTVDLKNFYQYLGNGRDLSYNATNLA